MYRYPPGHTLFPARARSILPPSLDHQASCIQNPASASPMKLLLIDGHYYVYRSFFAIPNLSNSRGEPTNAIFGFTKTLRLMLKHLRPDLGAVFWDEGLPKRRVELQPAYKETRKEMPKPMIPQLDSIQKLTPLLGLKNVSLPDTEADDLMGYYAIAGDSVDNIPGARIGRKTAAALIREHGSLDHLFADLNKVKSASTREKLLSARDQILQNRRMVELDCAMQLPVAIDDLRIKPDYAALIRALEECEFKSLLQEVRDEAVKAGASSQSELKL